MVFHVDNDFVGVLYGFFFDDGAKIVIVLKKKFLPYIDDCINK